MAKIKPLVISHATKEALNASIEEYQYIGYDESWMDIDRATNTLTIRTRPRRKGR